MSWVAVAVGAAAGAGLGAIAGSAKGGDAIWKGALVGGVAGAAGGGMYGFGTLATSAGGLGLGGMGAGALAGGTGGLVSGALGTALNGGNSSDYLRNMFTQGATGALLGGAGGAAFGPSAGEAGAIPTTPETATAATGTEYAPFGGDTASGLSNLEATPNVQQSITGPTAQPTQPALSDTVNTLGGNQYAAANTGTMTDIGGSSATPLELSGSYQAPTANNFRGLQMPTEANSGTGLDLTGSTGINPPENAMMPELTTSEGQTAAKGLGDYTAPGEYNAETLMPGKSQPSAWDKFWNTQGKGKMNFDDYLSGMGKAQLIGGGLKTLGAVATAPETQANKQALMDLYNQQNAQNQFYANQLQQTYENPQAYLSSPEAQATRSAALQKLVAQNAAAGRRTAGGAMQNQLMMNQLQNLGAYRAGMPRPNYGTAAQVYQNAAQYSPTADIFGGVASMATPLSLYSLFG